MIREQSGTTRPRRLTIVGRWLGLALVVTAIVALFATGAHRSLSVETVRDGVEQAGAWGVVFYLLAFAALQPFGLSAHLFVLAAAAVWGPLWSLPLAWVGALAATCVSYGFAHFVGREWVEERMPAKLRAYDERLATNGLWTVIVLRLLFYTFAPLQFMFGISRVRFVHVLAGSAIGLLPMMVGEIFIGASVFEAMKGWTWGA